ncbi:hypothetical protein [Mangrovicoccus algicola]|uniref:Uncharacterized protein n=1 Tax=Mangrovicoccus algicola TaxID=2771008 RepID=A0A8J6Z0X9_9RHOB|nr:hypothetical protein [Mangrovicoccus algicola]MBE3639456.1 hypothetical protein [Mangrovicoccus algicola]
MMFRRTLLSSAAALVLLACLPARAAGFDWNGVWAGKNPKNGRVTIITIREGRVISWSSDGEAAPIASASVTPEAVRIVHAEGAQVTMTPNRDGTATYLWKGRSGSAKHRLSRQPG